MEVWLVLLLVALGIPALGVAGFVLAINQRQAIAALQAEIGRLARQMEVLERAAAGLRRRPSGKSLSLSRAGSGCST
jgi:cell division protein FtsB